MSQMESGDYEWVGGVITHSSWYSQKISVDSYGYLSWVQLSKKSDSILHKKAK